MKVSTIMNKAPATVRPHQHLSDAAQLMWDGDCGWIPVIDDSDQVVGVVTDRDLCMAALTRGRRLDEIAIAGTMVTNVFSCKPDDELSDAILVMRNYAVRRLPVLDGEGRLVGLLSLSDLARHAADDSVESSLTPREIGITIAKICEPRSE